MEKGLFISFDGITCTGKTIHMKRIVELLGENNFNVVASAEPSASSFGKFIRMFIERHYDEISNSLIEEMQTDFIKFQEIRKISYSIETRYIFSAMEKVVKKEFSLLSDVEIQVIFILDRFFDVIQNITPVISSGGIKLNDRYDFSALFGAKSESDVNFLFQLQETILGEFYLKPDLTFLFLANPRICAERLKNCGKAVDIFESEERIAVVKKQYEYAYDLLKNKRNLFLFDSSGSRDDTFHKILKGFSDFFPTFSFY